MHRFCTVSAPKTAFCGNRPLSINKLHKERSKMVQFCSPTSPVTYHAFKLVQFFILGYLTIKNRKRYRNGKVLSALSTTYVGPLVKPVRFPSVGWRAIAVLKSPARAQNGVPKTTKRDKTCHAVAGYCSHISRLPRIYLVFGCLSVFSILAFPPFSFTHPSSHVKPRNFLFLVIFGHLAMPDVLCLRGSARAAKGCRSTWQLATRAPDAISRCASATRGLIRGFSFCFTYPNPRF
jgi:hypothetical protein